MDYEVVAKRDGDAIRFRLFSDAGEELAFHELSGSKLEDISRAYGKLGGLYEDVKPLKREEQEQIGRALLHDLLGSDEFLTPVSEAAIAHDQTIRLLIKSDDPDILAVPWEAIYHLQIEFLGLSARVIPIRCPEEKLIERKPVGEPPIRVLVMVCAPEDLPYDKVLDYEREQEIILAAFDDLQKRGIVELNTPPEGDIDSLERYLRELKPHIVHLSGHGVYRTGPLVEKEEGVFIFEDPQGLTQEIPSNRLSSLLKNYPSVNLVVLSGCQTAKTGTDPLKGMARALLAAGVPSVVGMSHSIGDARATEWARSFYRGIAHGEQVEKALAYARIDLQKVTEAHQTWMIPVLFSRAETGQLAQFDIEKVKKTTPAQDVVINLKGIAHLQTGFIGRRREQRTLLRDLREGKIRTLVIHGQGGSGKSTLAARLATTLVKQDNYKLIPHVVTTDERTFLEPFEELLRQNPGWVEQHKTLNSEEILQCLIDDFIVPGRYLIVLDNFEHNLDEENRFKSESTKVLVEKLAAIDQGASRVIITCRYRLEMDGDNGIHFHPLWSFSRAETIKKINRLEPLNQISFDQKKEVYDYLGGSPEAIRLLNGGLRQRPLSWGHVRSKLPKVREEMAEFIALEFLYANLEENTQTLLRRASVYDRPVYFDALQMQLSDEKIDVRPLAERLIDYALLERSVDLRTSLRLFQVHHVVAGVLSQKMATGEERKAHGKAGRYHRFIGQNVSFDQDDWLSAHDHFRKGGDLKQAEDVVFTIVHHLFRTSQYEKLRALSEEVIRHPSDEGARARGLHIKASTNLEQGRYGEAMELFDQAMEIDRRIGDTRGVAASLHGMATIYLAQGKYGEALEFSKQALEIRRRIGDTSGVAGALHQMASVHLYQGTYAEALEVFGQVLEIRRRIGDTSGMAGALHQMASVYLYQGMYVEALKLIEQALEIRRRIGDARGASETLHQVASIHLEQGKYGEALEVFEQALEISRRIGDTSGVAAALHQMASIHLVQDKYGEAQELFEQALEIKRNIGDTKGVAATLHQMASIHLYQGTYAEALEVFGQVLEIERRIGDTRGVSETLHQMASIHLEQGEYGEALEPFEQALEISRQNGETRSMAVTLHQIGLFYYKNKLIRKAGEFIYAAALILHEIKSGYFEQADQNFRAIVSELEEDELKQITDGVRENLEKGILPEIEPL